jgi:hypothetical protein
MFNKNTVAKAKLVKNTKLNTVKLIVAFNVNLKTREGGKLYYAFPTQQKCDYVSGDINTTDVLNTLTNACKVLGTTNIQLV